MSRPLLPGALALLQKMVDGQGITVWRSGSHSQIIAHELVPVHLAKLQEAGEPLAAGIHPERDAAPETRRQHSGIVPAGKVLYFATEKGKQVVNAAAKKGE